MPQSSHIRRDKRAFALSAVLILGSLGGCGGSSKTNSLVGANPNVVPVAESSLRADPIGAATPASFKTATSARFDLAVPLPDGASFQIEDKHDRWFVAMHPATGSVLRVRVWREDENQNRDRCEARARRSFTLPERDGTRLVDRRRVEVPPEHDTIAEARVRPKTKDKPAEGVVLAFGGWAKKCFAFVFTTQADDERVVAQRLATIVDGSLSRLRFSSELTPSRLPREDVR